MVFCFGWWSRNNGLFLWFPKYERITQKYAKARGWLSPKLSSRLLILRIISFLIYCILHILYYGIFFSFSVTCQFCMGIFSIIQGCYLSIRSIGVRVAASINLGDCISILLKVFFLHSLKRRSCCAWSHSIFSVLPSLISGLQVILF